MFLDKASSSFVDGEYSGCEGGSEAIWVAERNKTLLKRSSIGRRLAWVSRTSPAAVASAPVTILDIFLWIVESLRVIATEPRCLRPEGAGWMPVYQMSAA